MCEICNSTDIIFLREAVTNHCICNGCYKTLGIDMLPTRLVFGGIVEPLAVKCNISSPEKLHIWKSYNRDHFIDDNWICPHCKKDAYWFIELCHDSSENYIPFVTNKQNRDNYV